MFFFLSHYHIYIYIFIWRSYWISFFFFGLCTFIRLVFIFQLVLTKPRINYIRTILIFLSSLPAFMKHRSFVQIHRPKSTSLTVCPRPIVKTFDLTVELYIPLLQICLLTQRRAKSQSWGKGRWILGDLGEREGQGGGRWTYKHAERQTFRRRYNELYPGKYKKGKVITG